MVFLKRFLLYFFAIMSAANLVAAAVSASSDDMRLAQLRKDWNKDGLHKSHCRSAQEYIKTLEFLRKQKTIPEKEARQVARIVSKGCDESAERFARAYLTMQKSGVSLQKSVDVGLAMVREDPLTVKNFYEIFSKMYLNEYFDVNFRASFEIALELSKNFQGDLDVARKDFNDFSNFCLDQKKVGLSVNQCAQLAVRFARLSQFYPKGIYADFQEIYKLLRDDKRFGLPLVQAINSAEKILRNGPAAKINFLQAYNYATSKEGLDLSGKDALEFALGLAKDSYVGEGPPVFPGRQLLKTLSQTDTLDPDSEITESEDSSDANSQ